MPRRLTTVEWVEKAKIKHGSRYDYTEVDYKNGTTPVKIICPEHGPFFQTPHAHARQSGGGRCPECAVSTMRKGPQITTEDWVARAVKKFGDSFDYSEVDYVNANQEVRIGCPEHGIFLQTPKIHLMGRVVGCPECRKDRDKRKSYTTEQWIERARGKHGDRYDYTEVEYVNSYTKVKIRCKEHGIFLQTPNSHISGNNCPSCARRRAGGKRKTTEQWIATAKAKHGNKFEYSEAEYLNKNTTLKIICPTHGPFFQRPDNHLRSPTGCPECSFAARRIDDSDIISQFRKVHGDRYDYAKVRYRNIDTHVTIICEIHGEFSQTPFNHKGGQGCPACAKEYRPGKRVGRTEWIRRWRETHGDRYDYSKVDDEIVQTSVVKILCKVHGEFHQRVSEHMMYGCSKCVRPMQGASTEDWVEAFRGVHGEKYDYSEVNYQKSGVYVKIICPEHGPFPQVPSAHIQGSGCPRCFAPMRGATREEWIEKFNSIHDNAYNYHGWEYTNWHTKVKATCKTHGDFEVSIGNHTNRTRPQGCPSCATSGFDPGAPAELYCMKYSGPFGEFWKIGISSNTASRKITLQTSIKSTTLYNDYIIEIVDIKKFERGSDARKLEEDLLSMEELRFYPNEKFQGYTELFTVNPLQSIRSQ